MVTSPSIVFRADASTMMGVGHVMRCLTLADALREHGGDSVFICRDHPGHMGKLIVERGHRLELLPLADKVAIAADRVGYAAWLGDTEAGDAAATIAVLAGHRPDWVVADHYTLAAEWETAVGAHCEHLMVIDDLADRAHRCDLLLDQTFGRNAAAYAPLVPAAARLFCGAEFALLRPEFAALREQSLRRREDVGQVTQILLNLGGVDADNVTGAVLDALESASLPRDCRAKVVLGWQAPWVDDVRRKAGEASFEIEVLQEVDDMAQLMAESDLAIGAAGSSSWERCCLGLPTVMIVLADNQRMIAEQLAASGVASVVSRDRPPADLSTAVSALVRDASARRAMSARAASIVDGLGTSRIVDAMEFAHAG